MSAATDRHTQTACARCGARFHEPQRGRTGARCEDCRAQDEEPR